MATGTSLRLCSAGWRSPSLLGAALLAGCTRESTSDLIRSAREYQAKGEHQAAIIQLKNALQKQPDSAEARFLLGESSLIIGEPATAEKEFRKAEEFGYPPATRCSDDCAGDARQR